MEYSMTNEYSELKKANKIMWFSLVFLIIELLIHIYNSNTESSIKALFLASIPRAALTYIGLMISFRYHESNKYNKFLYIALILFSCIPNYSLYSTPFLGLTIGFYMNRNDLKIKNLITEYNFTKVINENHTDILTNIELNNAIACVKAKNQLDLDSERNQIYLSFDEQPVMKDLDNGLVVVYLIDIGDHFVHIQNKHLNDKKVSIDELHKIGLTNLISILESKTKIQQYGEVHGFSCDKYFEASTILHDKWWDKTLQELAPNGYIVALPSRNFFGVCDAKSKQGIEELKNLVTNAYHKETHPITPELYTRKNGKWVIYKPEMSHI